VEYQLRGVNQIQVSEKSGLTFARGLRSILRHDPDVILIGEIRDAETAQIAVQASLTGHLVFSTLHTNDAPATISRLLNMGVEPFLITASVNLVLAQRLARKICVDCKKPVETDPKVLLDLGEYAAVVPAEHGVLRPSVLLEPPRWHPEDRPARILLRRSRPRMGPCPTGVPPPSMRCNNRCYTAIITCR